MPFVSDPPIAVKIQKMKQRLRWDDPAIVQREIDRTRFVLDDGSSDGPEFSFLVIGDTGTGIQTHNAQRQVAQHMLPHLDSCRFVLHTGDVVYLVGSSEFYRDNFINPYKELLVGGDRPEKIAYDRMVFKVPMFLVPGNHDYYDLPFLEGLFAGLTLPLRRRLVKFKLDFDVGWHGSYQGKAYAQAFLDCWDRFESRDNLVRHLEQHYTVKTDTGWCLRYQPGQFTRLPNRYYTFRYGGIDFFALDSNTFNAPQPISKTSEGLTHRRSLEELRSHFEREKQELMQAAERLNPDLPDDAEQLDDMRAKIEQIDEVILDIDKQLEARETQAIDSEQLDWLQQRLIDSWNKADVRGRVLFFHHPPYVTEATKWNLAQTLEIRHHLRRVFDNVAAALGSLRGDRPLVDLILNGHAHCLEYIRTLDTGRADSHLNCIVCGGSGYSLRRQRQEGSDLMETFWEEGDRRARLVARSQLFVGRSGQGSKKRRPYSFLRIDVREGTPPQFVVRVFISERFQHQWYESELQPFTI
ncbi:Calcineurin-like phosphoesterase [Pleurocapsa sp. PCC 7327]|uniref:metallophosphoesterase family protein n=1 Tax=Pleurocapsa sp. PCC 7327 TaxID=118163 RepID=UPI00029FEC12|nr:metallophosphoesterase [Pleurocapsa sp. PCC 7327]AFY76988.1 Calcineurin-like phosphoesterase [Pleurocapsa sp. PCC 7327]